MVQYLRVQLLVRTWIHEVSIENGNLVEDLFQFAVELGGDLLVEEIAEPGAVLVIDETVLEDSQVLVVPQSVQLLLALKRKHNSLRFLFCNFQE